MHTRLRNAGVAAAALLLAATSLPASAAESHNNTLPYESGCAANKFVLSTYNIKGGTISVVYSRTCGTNWVEWNGPAIETTKTLRKSGSAGAMVYTTPETDYTSWAYSRQLNAPGNTQIEAFVNVGGTAVWVACSATCTWLVM